MTAFANLLANPKAISPATLQRKAEQEFVPQILQSGFRHRDSSEPIPRGFYAVIGIATYSVLELALLDEIASRSPSWTDWLRVDVFSVLECKSMRDLQSYLPGAEQVMNQTPILGVWKDQELTDFVTGLKDCRDAFMVLVSSNRQHSMG